MIRAWLAIAAVTGLLSIAAVTGLLSIAAVTGLLSIVAGAIAAHLAPGDWTAEILRTGALYGMVHAAVLIAVVAVAQSRGLPDITLIIAGWSFAAGASLFSLSLFTLALTGIVPFGWITPVGGVSLLLGWAALGVHAVQRPR
jgi:uncharacterized membrane protein YgdD (TMEM256/DUF423 family)